VPARGSVLASRFPERGLFTGIAILGCSWQWQKPHAACNPFRPEQILAYKASDKDKRVGGLILEVKGDFLPKDKGDSNPA